MKNQPLFALQVIDVRYSGSRPSVKNSLAVDAYHRADAYQAAGVPVAISEPVFPDEPRADVETDNLGRYGAVIAGIVAEARRAKQAVFLAGGDCTHITGVVGGLQDAYGPAARIGLVWFDAHGDFNTPQTTLSGMLGGMPVAVCAGLAYPRWREQSHIAAPLPADRILMVDVRNLDPAEEVLVRAVGVNVAAPAPEFPGADLRAAVADLAGRCNLIYLHIDADILDAAYVPNHQTREPNGPSMAQVLSAVDAVMASGKVAVLAVVSVSGEGQGSETALDSGIRLIQGALNSWQRHGHPV